MTIDHNTLLFFDASCLIAAAGSPSGGSGFLLSLCGRGFLKAAVSQPILLEAERNVIENLKPEAFGRYHRIVLLTPMMIATLPSQAQLRQYRQLVGEKDEHVIAAAIQAGAPFLLTLDQPLERRINAGNLPIHALSPGTFIKTVLVKHVDYPRIR